MERKIKTHPMEIPKEIIAWFFTETEKHLLEVHLVEVVGSDNLLVDVVYETKQRLEVMILIERVDDFNHAEEQRKLDKSEN